MSIEDVVELTMTGKLSYSGDITVVQAAQIIAYLHSGASPTAPGGPIAGDGEVIGVGSERRRVASSPRDVLVSSKAKTNPEKIVAFALYVERQGGKDTFKVDDIKPLFRQAREPAPGNFSRDLDAAIRLNWVAASSEKGEYYVTDVVANVLESGFENIRSGQNGSAKAKAKTATSRRPRKTAIPTPEAFKGIEVTPTVDGYINYHKVKTKTDKYLWAVNAAKLWGAEALTNTEIVWLTNQLGECIPSGDLAGYFRAHLKRGYVNKNTEGKVRITPGGTGYVRGLTAGAGE
jgi:hypothetical protein